jgi:hypothetical protein
MRRPCRRPNYPKRDHALSEAVVLNFVFFVLLVVFVSRIQRRRRATAEAQTSLKLSLRPGSGQSVAITWPPSEKVMKAVRRPGPPKQMLVT